MQVQGVPLREESVWLDVVDQDEDRRQDSPCEARVSWLMLSRQEGCMGEARFCHDLGVSSSLGGRSARVDVADEDWKRRQGLLRCVAREECRANGMVMSE